jgi:hypothetical protein
MKQHKTMQSKPVEDKVKNKEILKIAKIYLHLETLETRNSDSLDFHDTAVWSIRKALSAAYNAGQMRGQNGK